MAAQYARFYKCDLQVQTPEDSHHWDQNDPIRIGNPRTEADLQDKARQFLRRCHEVELEAIAVTDHNFANHVRERELFLTHLIQQNKTVAEELHREPIIIFPGFEVDIGYHMLCIFEPGTPLLEISNRLTTLGLVPGARIVNGRLAPLRANNQPVTLDTLLRIVQEQFDGIVIAAHAFSNDGIAKDGRDAADYRNEKLFAVEVNQVPLANRAQQILFGNDPAWQRERRLAYVMSSDCKKLRPANADDSNYLGFRHSWIKMSKPSIEALRQAFLDQSHAIAEKRPDESRIRFGDVRPDSILAYPKITSISVTGAAFLNDQVHEFSPSLNTLIGGRGAGKSSIIEYLRLSLDKANSVLGRLATSNFEKLKQTLEPNGKVEVGIRKDGKDWKIEFQIGDGPKIIQGEAIPDLGRFFQTRILSQGEISELAEDRSARSRIIDDLIRSRLDELHREGEDIVRQIKLLDEQILRKPELENRKKILETERLELKGRIDRLKQLEAPLKNWKLRLAEKDVLDSIRSEHERIVREIEASIPAKSNPDGSREEKAETASGDNVTDETLHPSIEKAQTDFSAITLALKEHLEKALEQFKQEVAALLHSQPISEWQAGFAGAKADYEKLRAELTAQGTDPEAYLEYQKQLKAREDSIAAVQKELDAIAALLVQRSNFLKKLEDTWDSESKARELIAQQLTDAVPKTKTGIPFVKVSVSRFGDDREFSLRLKDILKDRRRVSEDDLGQFDERKRTILPAQSLLAAVVANSPAGTPASRTFLSWVRELRAGNEPNGCPWPSTDRRTKAIIEWITPSIEADLSLWRQPDRVRVELYRQDGTLAGELEQGLSVGQRCTAILALLLAQDDAPAIIDQPENDLDNEFVFRELVPLLRRIKETRQLIVATHNANIPVNADAELIIALEARGGRGEIHAVGALDRNNVRLAVEEILEGSEEAFRRRYEKYGF